MNSTGGRYTCPKCHRFSAPSFPSVMRHIGSVHSWEPNFSITCGIDGCPRTYTSYRYFRRHVCKQHSRYTEDSGDSNSPNNDSQDSLDETLGSSLPSARNCGPAYKRSAALFVLKSKEERRISQLALDGLLEDFHELCETQQNCLRKEVKECLQSLSCSTQVIEAVDRVVHQSRTNLPFDGLQTAYLQQQYFQENFNFVEPVERKLGQVSRVCTVGNDTRIKLSWETVFDIPLLESLKQQLADEHILDEVLRGHTRTDDLLEDYCDGLQFQNHPLFSTEPQSLQVMLYYDEIEICNPLGAAKKIHKLGMFYYQLGNLSPEYRSSLKSIHLLAVAKSSVIMKYGVNRILEPFIEAIQQLEQDEGVTFYLGDPQCAYTFRGTITLTCGDNLASYLVGGYKQLSSALRKCRFCLAVSEDMQEKFCTTEFAPRTRETHEQHVAALDGPLREHMATTYGVQFDSILNSSSFFHVTTGLPPDIMHDILEGSLQYEVKELLNSLVNEKSYFSLAILNQKIERFPYMQTDKDNKPATITAANLTTSDHSLKQKASRMWCLARLLPLMVGEFVPEDDEQWKLFMTLLTIMDYVFAPRANQQIVSYLSVLIRQHHQEFKSLYPDSPITPKLHNMIHIPEWIERCGPMVHCWCMRYEAKHNYFKDLAHKIKCFKNICKSLAYHHQYMLCYQMFHSQSLVKEMRISRSTVTYPDELPYYDVLLESQKVSRTCSVFNRVKWVQIKGCKYTLGSVIVIKADFIPTFGLIIDLLMVEVDICLFICEVVVTDHFVEHLHAFQIEREDTVSLAIMTHKELADYHVLSLYKHRQALYVVPKYSLHI